MNRRIVCWISSDVATLVAAKLAIRENEQSANPLPLVVAAHRYLGEQACEQAARYLGVPVTIIMPGQFFSFGQDGDVHEYGVPADEQCAFTALQSAMPDLKMSSTLADRALRRDDCDELAIRAGLSYFLPVVVLPLVKVAA